jgi:hypothetical protein
MGFTIVAIIPKTAEAIKEKLKTEGLRAYGTALGEAISPAVSATLGSVGRGAAATASRAKAEQRYGAEAKYSDVAAWTKEKEAQVKKGGL